MTVCDVAIGDLQLTSVTLVTQPTQTIKHNSPTYTYSLKKLFTSLRGFNALTFRWLLSFVPGDIASSSFSLLGNENEREPFFRSLSEVRGVWEIKGVLLISLPLAECSLVFLVELFTCFPDDLVFLFSSSESEEMWDLFAKRRFLADKLVSGRSSSPSLDSAILPGFAAC